MFSSYKNMKHFVVLYPDSDYGVNKYMFTLVGNGFLTSLHSHQSNHFTWPVLTFINMYKEVMASRLMVGSDIAVDNITTVVVAYVNKTSSCLN